MAEYQPGYLFFAFGSQPFRTFYLTYAYLSLYLVRMPYWALKSIRPSDRPRRSWSLTRTLQVYQARFLSSLTARIGGLWPPPNHLALDESPDANGVWINPIPDSLIRGDIKLWAEVANVRPIKIPGYWMYSKDGANNHSSRAHASSELKVGEREKVLLFLHGGAYVLLSAHPSSGTSDIARALLESCAPTVKSVFSVEYRLSAAKPATTSTHPAKLNPFPAALLDSLAGYQYLLLLGYSPDNIIVAGDSAGANLTLAMTRYIISLTSSVPAANSAHGPPTTLPIPSALILLSPWADLSHGLRPASPDSSIITNARTDFLSGPYSQFELYAVHAYAGPLRVPELSNNIYISPAPPSPSIPSTSLTFNGFPRTFILAGDGEFGLDAIQRLRDRMVRDLGWGDAGVTYHESVDAVHDFIMFEWHEPQRTQSLREIGAWIRRIFV